MLLLQVGCLLRQIGLAVGSLFVRCRHDSCGLRLSFHEGSSGLSLGEASRLILFDSFGEGFFGLALLLIEISLCPAPDHLDLGLDRGAHLRRLGPCGLGDA